VHRHQPACVPEALLTFELPGDGLHGPPLDRGVEPVPSRREIALLAHRGVPAAGLAQSGIIKSSIGIGALLLEGIGDTLRVSLTADPVDEVVVAKKILTALCLRDTGIDVISCPTCGRCTINLIALVKQAEKELLVIERKYPEKKLKVAIMGCVVNGPGEAKDADIGIAWGGAAGVLFKKGKKIKLVKEHELLKTLVTEVLHEMV
jgi:(E)-4-hydroxy-3-methylbut-2-enyl-diphosphate synthase